MASQRKPKVGSFAVGSVSRSTRSQFCWTANWLAR
jgi:hypothetical protein